MLIHADPIMMSNSLDPVQTLTSTQVTVGKMTPILFQDGHKGYHNVSNLSTPRLDFSVSEYKELILGLI